MACLPCKARAAARREAAAAVPRHNVEYTVEPDGGEPRTFKSPGEAARYAKSTGGTVKAR